MDISVELSELDGLLDVCKKEVVEVLTEAGEQYVADAVAEGNYHDVTGNLRRSNYYEVTAEGLEMGNKADYASKVEAQGKEVSSTFALRAMIKLKERLG